MLRQEARKTPGTLKFSTEESGKSWGFGTENKVKKCHWLASSPLCKNLHRNNDACGGTGAAADVSGRHAVWWSKGDGRGEKERSLYSTSPGEHFSRWRLFRAAKCSWQHPITKSAGLTSGKR